MPLPEFPPESRYFVWVGGQDSGRELRTYAHVVAHRHGTSCYVEGIDYTPEYSNIYSLDRLRRDLYLLGRPLWWEVTRVGFELAQSSEESGESALREMTLYRRHNTEPLWSQPPPPPPKTNHKIGVPKGKLP